MENTVQVKGEEEIRLCGRGDLDLANTLGSCALFASLVDTVTKFGAGVDELEVDLLQILTGGMNLKTATQGQDTLLDTRA